MKCTFRGGSAGVILGGGVGIVMGGGVGLGSEFMVRLPLVAPRPVQAVAEEPTAAGTSSRARSIVIVEDNPNVATALQVALEQAGHSVQLSADGPSTLAAAPTLKPDALLIDIGLPGMDGYELAAQLKEERTTKNARRIAVSGFKRRELAEDVFDEYLTKPVDVAALLDLLEQR